MRKKTVNILLFLGVVSVIVAVAMVAKPVIAQCSPTDPACQPPPEQPTCGVPGTPPCPVEQNNEKKKKPTKVPIFIPSRTPTSTVTYTPTATPTDPATPAPCGLPGLPDCPGVSPLSIKCSGVYNYSLNPNYPSLKFNYTTPIATGGCQGSSANEVCAPPSGSNFTEGNTTVTCSVIDSCGNTASCSFTVMIDLWTSTPTPVGAAPGSPGGSGTAGQNVIPPVSLLPAVKNGIIGVLFIAIIIIGGLGLRRFFGKRDLPSSPSDQFVKLTRPPGDGGSDQFHKTDGSSQFIKGDGSNQFFKFKTPSDGVNLGGGIESATMTIHDIHFDPQDIINSFDANGFNSNGFNANGFDHNGFNSNGFDANGFDHNGFNSNGFNANGFDHNGFNSNGFNANGFDQNGFNSNGFDANGLDANGLDSNGFKGGEWIGHQ